MKAIVDFVPLLLFFLANKWYDLMFATAVLIVSTIIAVGVLYLKEKKIAMVPLVSALLVGVFGSLTLVSEDEIFIKMKPTIVNLLFASILAIGLWRGKSLIQFLLQDAVTLPGHIWTILTKRWALFFVGLAVLNELIWRNFSTDFWVQFKVFGMLPITITFMLCQFPLMKPYLLEPSPEGEKNGR